LIDPDYIVKLENSYEDLGKIETELGLKKSKLEELAKSEHHTQRSEKKNLNSAGTGILW
jgi:hypothetical protein